MSHFSVLVIGPNIEAQLQPYHKFECTGELDEYVIDVDQTDELVTHIEGSEEPTPEAKLQDALEYFGFEDRVIDDEDNADREGKHKYGFAVVRDGKLIKAIDRTNPNAKWDWWQLGGRWTGFLKLKDGSEGTNGSPGLMTECAPAGYADQTTIGAVDLEGMRDAAGTKAATNWDLAAEITKDTPVHETWEVMRDRMQKAKVPMDDIRNAYHDQERVKKFGEDERAKAFGFFRSADEFLIDRNAYIQNARNGAICTFAVVKDGQWHERGSMGWWGCVSDEKENREWEKQFTALLDGLPPDTLVSVVDCHV